MNPSDKQLPFITRGQLAFQEGTVFSLEIDVITVEGVGYFLRGFTKEGPFQFSITPAAAGAIESFSFALPDIPIFFTVVGDTADPITNGATFIVYLGINRSRYNILVQGSVSPLFGLSWPNTAPPAELQKHGKSAQMVSANPAAGAEAQLTVPARQWLLLKGVFLTFVAAAAAANRRVSIEINLPNGALFAITSPATIVISQTSRIHWFEGAVSMDDQVSFIQHAPLPSGLLLPPGTTITTVTAGLNVGDNMTALTAYGELIHGAST